MITDRQIATILSEPGWLQALSDWAAAGAATRDDALLRPAAPQTWKELKNLLVETAWFTAEGATLTPTPEGRDLLTRIQQLVNLLRLQASGELPEECFRRPPRGTAVEIGCGVGQALLCMGRAGHTPLYGYDTSPLALRIAETVLERAGMKARLLATDATTLQEIPDASVALVYSRSAFQYFHVARLAAGVGRVLGPGGRVVVDVPSWRFYLSQVLRSLRFRARWGVVCRYSAVLLRTLLYLGTRWQPRCGASTPELGWGPAVARRFAAAARLEVVSIAPKPSVHGIECVLEKRG
jgi:SAM-dependent methyltransferase